MTDNTRLSKWTKEKLINEVMQLRIQRRVLLNVTTNRKENNHEIKKLKKELQHRREI